jgi:hypothetical protein
MESSIEWYFSWVPWNITIQRRDCNIISTVSKVLILHGWFSKPFCRKIQEFVQLVLLQHTDLHCDQKKILFFWAAKFSTLINHDNAISLKIYQQRPLGTILLFLFVLYIEDRQQNISIPRKDYILYQNICRLYGLYVCVYVCS